MTSIPASTPCTLVCRIDPATGLCAGCGRSRDEIAAWGRFAESERRRIMALLPERRRRARTEPARAEA